MSAASHHRMAQALSKQAESAMRAGDRRAAIEKYAAAAQLEEQALASLSRDKIRTYGILAVSAAALWYKAQKHEEAEHVAHAALTRKDLLAHARTELREFLEVIWDEQRMRSQEHVRMAEQITVSMRGGQVGVGTAPFLLAVNVQAVFGAIITRLAENIGGFPYRSQGLPPPEFQNLFQQRIAVASPGSYRFTIHLAGPRQLELELDARPTIDPKVVAKTVLEFVEYASLGANDALEAIVPDMEYRNGALRLLKSAAPDGKLLGELAIFHHRADEDTPIIHLDQRSRARIDRLISRAESTADALEICGVLRAVNLDKRSLRIIESSGAAVACVAPHGLLDDVVGSLINSRVVARGEWTGRGRTQFKIADIQLDDDS